jgi:hypothetical protein
MFGRKDVIKKQRGGFKNKETKPSIFFFLPKAVFEHVYISTGRQRLPGCVELCM